MSYQPLQATSLGSGALQSSHCSRRGCLHPPTETQRRCLRHLWAGSGVVAVVVLQGWELSSPTPNPPHLFISTHSSTSDLFAQLKMFRALSVFALLPLFVLAVL